jgi:hypothetical protein
MRHQVYAAAGLMLAAGLALTGCHQGGSDGAAGTAGTDRPAGAGVAAGQGGTATAAATAPGTADPACAGGRWPRAIPMDTVGLPLAAAEHGELRCYHLARALAPDGHDVLKGAPGGWTISRVDPVVGTPVGVRDPVTLYVIATAATPVPAAATATTTAPSPAPSPSAGHAPATPRTPAATVRAAAPRPTHRAATRVPAATARPAPLRTTEPPVDDHGGATALCNDGTLSYSAHHRGTCSHHHGVAVWYK